MNEPVKRLVPVHPRDLEILLLVAESPRHGYGIMQELRAAGQWVLGPGTLYRVLKDMVGQGLLSAGGDPADSVEGPPRRYYRITPVGKRLLKEEVARMSAIVTRAGPVVRSR